MRRLATIQLGLSGALVKRLLGVDFLAKEV